jgi:hypothetical protein
VDSNKVALVLGIVLIGGFLALPLLNPQGGKSGSKPAAGTSAAATATPTAPPALGEADLIGSVWRAETPRGPMNVALNGGGQFVATPESAITAGMLQSLTGSSQLVGSWQVNGANITLNAQAAGQAVNITGQISGTDIVIQGQKAQRIQ